MSRRTPFSSAAQPAGDAAQRDFDEGNGSGSEDLDRAKEEEMRQDRYMAACRLRSVEAQGVIATVAPDMRDAAGMGQQAQPGYGRHDNTRTELSTPDESPFATPTPHMLRSGSGSGADGQHNGGHGHRVQRKNDKFASAAAAGGDASLLADLPPEQRLVLEWCNISCWATSSVNDSKLNVKSIVKPIQDRFSSLKQTVSRCTTRTGKSSPPSHPDPETGLAITAAPPTTQKHAKQILHSINGHVLPGQVMALMGPSGSGKTSLLSILGGRAPAQLKLEGSVTLNGARLSKATRRRLGFVLQDDILYESLTVHETLTFSGLLRLPKTMTREEKMRRIEAVMAVLGLSRSRDTIIGGYFMRGVSGGERKRVSVGQELLINPSVLLLDEPTSGLDSTTALHLVKLLHNLAAGGRAILTTIHQPSSRLYQHLDKVMLLAEGHVIYMGDGRLAADWFGHLGFSLPYGVNLADHLLDCAMGEVGYDSSAPGACGTHVSKDDDDGQGKERSMHGRNAVHSLYTTFESWYAHHPSGFTLGSSPNPTSSPGPRRIGLLSSSREVAGMLLDGVHLLPCSTRRSTARANLAHTTATNNGTATTAVVAQPGVGNEGSDPHRLRPAADGEGAKGQGRYDVGGVVTSTKDTTAVSDEHQAKGKGCWGNRRKSGGSDDTPFLEQVSILWRRALKVRRFESLSGQQLFQLTAVAIITGLLWWQRSRNYNLAGANDALGLLFFEVVFVSFRSLFSALFTFPNEFRILSKERPAGNPKLLAYYVARTLADLPIEILFPSLFIIIVYWFGGLRPTAGAFFSNWASVLLVVLTAQSWGLLIGGLFMDPKTAQSVTTVIILSFMLVGGYYVRDVPVWIGWIKYLSFLYWGNNLLLKIQFRGQDIHECSVSGQAAPAGVCTAGQDVQSALRLPINPNQAVYPEVLVILAMLIVLRYATWVVLKWKISQSQRTL